MSYKDMPLGDNGDLDLDNFSLDQIVRCARFGL